MNFYEVIIYKSIITQRFQFWHQLHSNLALQYELLKSLNNRLDVEIQCD